MGLGIAILLNGSDASALGEPTKVEVHERLGRPTHYRLRFPLPVEERDLPLAAHDDLAPDQERRFHAPVERPSDDAVEGSSMELWLATQEEHNDSSLSRRFTNAPAPELENPEEIAEVAELDENAPLEPGQSRSFGPPPQPESESDEE